MEPSLGVILLLLLFGGTHIGLASRPMRRLLVARLGERAFTLLFSLVAALTFSILVAYYAAHQHEGAPGLALGGYAGVRWLAMGGITLGIMLMTGTFSGYWSSPMAMFRGEPRAPQGLERITRHPFFVGTALVGLTHLFLAAHLVGAVAMGGLGLIAILGARHQDAKLLRLRGPSYADYLGVTSMLPFAAIAAGRQRLVWGELPFVHLAVGLGLALALRNAHAGIFSHGGAWVIGATVGGAGAILAFEIFRRGRQAGKRDREVLEAN